MRRRHENRCCLLRQGTKKHKVLLAISRESGPPVSWRRKGLEKCRRYATYHVTRILPPPLWQSFVPKATQWCFMTCTSLARLTSIVFCIVCAQCRYPHAKPRLYKWGQRAKHRKTTRVVLCEGYKRFLGSIEIQYSIGTMNIPRQRD